MKTSKWQDKKGKNVVKPKEANSASMELDEEYRDLVKKHAHELEEFKKSKKARLEEQTAEGQKQFSKSAEAVAAPAGAPSCG